MALLVTHRLLNNKIELLKYYIINYVWQSLNLQFLIKFYINIRNLNLKGPRLLII